MSPEDAGAYTVVVSNAHGSVTSDPAILTVLLRPPKIITEPADQTVVSGAAAILTVTATGSLPMTYQWRRNGVELTDGDGIGGAQTATLNIAAAGIQDLGVYAVVMQNAYGSVTSAPVSLAVILAPPTITRQPQGQTVALGTTITLLVQATGSLPLGYQWQREGVDVVDGGRISGAMTSTLTISKLSLDDLGNYSVVVGNTFGLVRSATVELKTSSAVLFSAVQDGFLLVSWNEPGRGLMLQRTSSVANPDWEDIPGSERTNRMEFPMTKATEYFRLLGALPPGLIAWWPGDGNADDIVGSNHGTLVNGATFAPGIVGMAFSFDDRTSAHVTIPTSPSLNVGTGDFSMECWISTTSTKDIGTIQDKRRVSGYHFFVCDGGIGPGIQLMYSGLANTVGCNADLLLADGRFHHVAVSVHRNSTDGMKLYLDGNVVKTGDPTPFSTSSLDNDADFLIGGHSYDDWRTFSGLIDEFRFYKRALDDDEIRAIYETGIAGVTRVSH